MHADYDSDLSQRLISLSRPQKFPFSALTLLIGWQEGHPACKKNWALVCWWWRFDWSFARLIVPVITTTVVILSSNRIENGDIPVSSYPGWAGKWPSGGPIAKCTQQLYTASTLLRLANPLPIAYVTTTKVRVRVRLGLGSLNLTVTLTWTLTVTVTLTLVTGQQLRNVLVITPPC